MKHAVFYLFFASLLHICSAQCKGLWRSKGYFSLYGTPYNSRCEYVVSFTTGQDLKWLEFIELNHPETGLMKVTIDTHTVSLNSQYAECTGTSFTLDGEPYRLDLESDSVMWVICPNYKILFVPLDVPQTPHFDKEEILLSMLGKEFEYMSEYDNNIYGQKFIDEEVKLMQLDQVEPFETAWKLIEFEGMFFIKSQVFPPFLILGMTEDEIHGFAIDYRDDIYKAAFKPTKAFFKE